MNDLINSKIGDGSPSKQKMSAVETHYWEFATHLTSSQWRALQYLIVTKESTPDTEVNRILGEYLDKVDVPADFNEADCQE